MNFPTDYDSILKRIQEIEPVAYCKSRNFLDGKVTYLSPYISRGVISTKQVFDHVMTLGYKPYQIEKMLQELAWRDYWQQIWINKGIEIDQDLRSEQKGAIHQSISISLLHRRTGVTAIDEGIETLYDTGYMHNHLRMYTAAITCNIGKNHWRYPAQWMYYHLLDGDWASNALSWQWVAGTNSNKQYIANQENINKYCKTDDKDTFLDIGYDELANIAVPKELEEITDVELKTNLPKTSKIVLNEEIPTAIYTYYNLDPNWRKEQEMNRILLLEPSFFKKYPVGDKCIQFVTDLIENIENCQVFIGEFFDFESKFKPIQAYFKEHPTNNHFKGIEDSRDWISPDVQGDFKSFFGYWKKVKKQLQL
ncbi:deoxyribodipyrimidine photolyase [Flavobacteriales bacterium]|jgi:deoxyribodipyrimidine photo-lyase|nr:deoxyribodipyrimidine photolyase [Flavobacteriales bacterium]